jgi:hypothetical protein
MVSHELRTPITVDNAGKHAPPGTPICVEVS